MAYFPSNDIYKLSVMGICRSIWKSTSRPVILHFYHQFRLEQLSISLRVFDGGLKLRNSLVTSWRHLRFSLFSYCPILTFWKICYNSNYIFDACIRCIKTYGLNTYGKLRLFTYGELSLFTSWVPKITIKQLSW